MTAWTFHECNSRQKNCYKNTDDQAIYAADGHILAVDIMERYIVQCDEYIMAC